MNDRNYSSSSIRYKGIVYENVREIESTTRILNQTGNVTIEFNYPILRSGNYRFEVESISKEGNEIKKARDFAIKSENYPSIRNVREFAYPLYYLMSKKEYEKLLIIKDEQELKKAVDRFWLSHIDHVSTAKSVIELYYNRVEQANKLFSNYKEGWKTDQGMIYILFGAAWYENTDLTKLQWSYSFNQNDPERNFTFTTPRIKSDFYPFDNYILERSSDYHAIYYQQINRWLNGSILQRNL